MEIGEISELFFDEPLISFDIIDTGRGEADRRKVIIAELDSGGKRVIKISDNDFTSPERITVWQRTVEEYRRLGYYCPRIFSDRSGAFPTVSFEGRDCIAYAEEFSLYQTAESRHGITALPERYADEAWIMTARIASQYLSYCDFPSGYCLFEKFCPSYKTDEVLEVAQDWLKAARALPEELQPQVERIWSLWCENRAALEPLYRKLPTTVLQADLNSTNILVDDDDGFVGVCDFNLCGREVFLNYLMREIDDEADLFDRLNSICRKLSLVKAHYSFSEAEINAAPLIFRCIAPLWYTHERFSENTGDILKLKDILDGIESVFTENIDLSPYMK